MLNYVLIGLGCIVLILLFSLFASYNYILSNLNKIVYRTAEYIVLKEFKKNKKTIYNKDKEYTTATQKAIQSKMTEINASCQFYEKDFYYFYKRNKPILKKNVPNLINRYMKERTKCQFTNNFSTISPEQFFKLREKQSGDMVGCYVIYNKNKRMYYVGQATRLFFRVNQHFTGHGNGDVYADYKRGKDKFTIKLIPLVNSGYYDLDKLEKDLIKKYNAYEKGYNKTAGNGN